MIKHNDDQKQYQILCFFSFCCKNKINISKEREVAKIKSWVIEWSWKSFISNALVTSYSQFPGWNVEGLAISFN